MNGADRIETSGHPLIRKLRTARKVWSETGSAGARELLNSNFQALSRTLPGGLVRAGFQRFRPSDDATRQFLLQGLYEAPERRAVKRYLSRTIPVVEFGASIGVVSCAINRRLKTPARHVAVEANPEVVSVLAENREINHCQFEIVHGAVGPEGKTITFFIGGDTLCSSAYTRTAQSVTVPVVTLREILDARGFDRCAVVCDIEGAEIDLIRRELSTFRKRVETFIVEFHPAISGAEEVEATRRLLIENGFELRRQDAEVFVFQNMGVLEVSNPKSGN